MSASLERATPTGMLFYDICPGGYCRHPISAKTPEALQVAADDHLAWMRSPRRMVLSDPNEVPTGPTPTHEWLA